MICADLSFCHKDWANDESADIEYEEPRVIRRADILSFLHNRMSSGLITKVLHVDPKTVRNVAHVHLEDGTDAAL
jgi:hypothetical protein